MATSINIDSSTNIPVKVSKKLNYSPALGKSTSTFVKTRYLYDVQYLVVYAKSVSM